MSLVVRPAQERGHAHHGWLNSRHSFSFADYYDPSHMGFSALRVINDDIVQGKGGFAPHGHRNMEIISYVVEGGLEHRDSIGEGGVLRPGDVQAMSAGTGVRHSEFNASASEPVRFLQIWILPDAQDAPPHYAQRHFAPGERRGRFRLVASPDGAEESLTIRQDARMYAALLDEGEQTAATLAPGRNVWVQIATGAATVNGVALTEGDGAAITGETEIAVVSDAAGSQILLFDLP